MRYFDISRGIFSSQNYKDDPLPELERLKNITEDGYNLSVLTTCLHTGTHIDAPLHFLNGGEDISEAAPGLFIGECRIAEITSDMITGADIDGLRLRGSCRRLLIRGGRITVSAAYCIADEGVRLLGIDGVTAGTEQDDTEVHQILAKAGVYILENVNLLGINPGIYNLVCPPLKIEGGEASPCRAVIWKREL